MIYVVALFLLSQIVLRYDVRFVVRRWNLFTVLLVPLIEKFGNNAVVSDAPDIYCTFKFFLFAQNGD